MQQEIRYTTANGLRFAYYEMGTGPLVLLLHGFPDTPHTWGDLQPRIAAAGYRVVAPFMRGYPPSDVPEDTALYGWELAVDDIVAVMRGLDIERAHVVGLSMGGYAALQFGLRHPERASAIVAAGVGSGSPPSERDAWLRETSVLARIFIDHGMAGIAAGVDEDPLEGAGRRGRSGRRGDDRQRRDRAAG